MFRKLRDPHSGKAASQFIGLAALGVLLAMVSAVVIRSWRSGYLPVKEVAFGADPETRIRKGRDLTLEKGLETLTDSQKSLYYRALEYKQAGDSLRALVNLEQIITGKPDFIPAYYHAATCSDPAKAETLFLKGLEKDSGHPWLRQAYGSLLWNSGRKEAARRQFEEALKQAPQFTYPYVALGKYHLSLGNFQVAKEKLRIAISLAEGGADAPYDLLAMAFYRMGQNDSAMAAADVAESKSMRTPELEFVKASLRQGRREVSATSTKDAVFAISLLNSLVKENPRHAGLWKALGQAYYHGMLFGLAMESFDSSFKYDSTLVGLSQDRQAAQQAWEAERSGGRTATQGATRQSEVRKPKENTESDATTAALRSALQGEEDARVIIPVRSAILGTYAVSWGSSPSEVIQAYPKKDFQSVPGGNLLETFTEDGVVHEHLLAFREGKLWGVRIFLSDSSGATGDIFGRMIGIKTKISGEGKGTGEATCPGFKAFQGVIWENDDTFEFMAQFLGREWQVRMVRMGRQFLPQERRLCDLVVFLNEDSWK